MSRPLSLAVTHSLSLSLLLSHSLSISLTHVRTYTHTRALLYSHTISLSLSLLSGYQHVCDEHTLDVNIPDGKKDLQNTLNLFYCEKVKKLDS